MRKCIWCEGEFKPTHLGIRTDGLYQMEVHCSWQCDMANTVESVSKWNRPKRRRLLTRIWNLDTVDMFMQALAKGEIPEKGSRKGASILRVS